MIEKAPPEASDAAATAPVFLGALLGFRVWKLRPGGSLEPLWKSDRAWPTQPERARCLESFRYLSPQERREDIEVDHPSPVSWCSCGWHAYHTLAGGLYEFNTHRLSPGSYVLGAVCGAGRVEIHPEGWRAERAQILGLCGEVHSKNGIPTDRGDVDLQAAAERYGVRVLSTPALLEDYALGLGAVPFSGEERSRASRWKNRCLQAVAWAGAQTHFLKKK